MVPYPRRARTHTRKATNRNDARARDDASPETSRTNAKTHARRFCRDPCLLRCLSSSRVMSSHRLPFLPFLPFPAFAAATFAATKAGARSSPSAAISPENSLRRSSALMLAAPCAPRTATCFLRLPLYEARSRRGSHRSSSGGGPGFWGSKPFGYNGAFFRRGFRFRRCLANCRAARRARHLPLEPAARAATDAGSASPARPRPARGTRQGRALGRGDRERSARTGPSAARAPRPPAPPRAFVIRAAGRRPRRTPRQPRRRACASARSAARSRRGGTAEAVSISSRTRSAPAPAGEVEQRAASPSPRARRRASASKSIAPRSAAAASAYSPELASCAPGSTSRTARASPPARASRSAARSASCAPPACALPPPPRRAGGGRANRYRDFDGRDRLLACARRLPHERHRAVVHHRIARRRAHAERRDVRAQNAVRVAELRREGTGAPPRGREAPPGWSPPPASRGRASGTRSRSRVVVFHVARVRACVVVGDRNPNTPR